MQVVDGLVVLGTVFYIAFRIDPCKELARIEIEERVAKASGAPPWYPVAGDREKYPSRKVEMQERCAAQRF